jgi:hypothetical protein
MPTERVNLGVAAVNGVVYALGGTHYAMIEGKSTQAASNANEAYDPSPTLGQQGVDACCAFPLWHSRVAGQNLLLWRKYNPSLRPSRRHLATLNVHAYPKKQPPSHTVNGKIYLIGGIVTAASGITQFSALNEVYDPATDTWVTRSPLPFAVANYASATVDGKICHIRTMPKRLLNHIQRPPPPSKSTTPKPTLGQPAHPFPRVQSAAPPQPRRKP